MLEPQPLLKVSQLNLLAKRMLEVNLAQVLVEGEISNLAKPSSGHLYFSLKDETAQIRAVMFYPNNLALNFIPQNGMHVIVTAQVSLYEARGDYQLIVAQLTLAGAGLLHTRFLQLKTKLAMEGLFDQVHKQPLIKLPQRIGVITSPTGAVIRDILSILKRRCPSVEVLIYPVVVQGAEAATQIVAALHQANLQQACEVLIVARGGGSLEDLWPFNEESVARAIFASSIPIISAIGHETDFTIADFVADVRAPTPSVAAELVVPDQAEWRHHVTTLHKCLANLIHYKLGQVNLILANLKARLRHPRYYLAGPAQGLDDLERRLYLVIHHCLVESKHQLVKRSTALHVISPLATLLRGYAIVSKNHNIVRHITELKLNDQLQVKLVDGELKCIVQEIKST